ncbi:MAG: 30S ribosome-binding factor RbfA [Bdellovibrionales bacterium]|nr:30S ribosome-binding factor RbfA [Bdellovibrionales bacterium]
MTISRNQPFKRTDRIADQLRKIVSEIFTQKIHHWGVEGITITHMEVAPDIKHAKAYYRLLDVSKKEEVRQNLAKIMPIIQKEIGRQMRTKYTPHVHFIYDEALEHGDRIFDLLDQVKDQS